MLDFAANLAYSAGHILRAGAGRERTVEAKNYADVVTDVDRASEALIVATIHAHFPEHTVVAEEGGGSVGTSPFSWVVDPLDGTLNYLHGLPWYCVSIALLRDGEPFIGVVYDPVRDELFAGERGCGARVNGRPIHVSNTRALRAALLSTGFAYDRFDRPDTNLREHNHLLFKCRDIRRPGSAALDLCHVAAGRSDGHWELGLKPWDCAAGILLVAEAGGIVSDWDGARWANPGDRVVATNGHLHTELLHELSAAGSSDQQFS